MNPQLPVGVKKRETEKYVRSIKQTLVIEKLNKSK